MVLQQSQASLDWQNSLLAGATAGGVALLLWMIQNAVAFCLRRRRRTNYLKTLLDIYLEDIAAQRDVVQAHLRQILQQDRLGDGIRRVGGDVDDLLAARASAADVLDPESLRRATRLISVIAATERLLAEFMENTNALVDAPPGHERDQHYGRAVLEGARLLILFDELPTPPVGELAKLRARYSVEYPSKWLLGDVDGVIEDISTRLGLPTPPRKVD